MRRVLFGLLLLGLALYLLTGVTEIRPGERAVVRRFGRVLDETPGPGLWVGLPWGMDRVDRVSVDTLRRVAVGHQPDADGEVASPAGQLLTGDHNLVNVQVALAYTVREEQAADYVVQADRADGLVAKAAESVLAEWAASRSVDDVLLRGKAELPEWVVARTQERLEPYRLGVQLRQANVAHLAPPDDVKASFDDVTRAQAEIRTGAHKAEEYAVRKVQEAQSEKYRREQSAAAYAREQELKARAEADSFEKRLAQYRQLRRDNPEYLRGIWFAALGKLFAALKQGGKLDLLDKHLSGDGLDLTVIQPPPGKK
jgi:membrane protease subunit HflK